MPYYDTGFPLAEYDALSRAWVATSQYGYPMAWRKAASDAVEFSRTFYRDHEGTVEAPRILEPVS